MPYRIYKYVAFYFAGHGGLIDQDSIQFIVGLQIEDNQKTEEIHCIDDYIINQFKPLH